MSLWGCSVPRVAGWRSHSNGPGAAGWCSHSHCLEWLAGVATVVLVGISQVGDMQYSVHVGKVYCIIKHVTGVRTNFVIWVKNFKREIYLNK